MNSSKTSGTASMASAHTFLPLNLLNNNERKKEILCQIIERLTFTPALIYSFTLSYSYVYIHTRLQVNFLKNGMLTIELSHTEQSSRKYKRRVP